MMTSLVGLEMLMGGSFTLKSVFDLMRDASSAMLTTKFIWHSLLPRQMSIFLWRLFIKRLPLDEGLWKKGYSLASRCCCCLQYDMETFTHVFLTSEIASHVWTYFHGRLGVPMRDYSIRHRCMSWWLHSDSIIYFLLPSLILWPL